MRLFRGPSMLPQNQDRKLRRGGLAVGGGGAPVAVVGVEVRAAAGVSAMVGFLRTR